MSQAVEGTPVSRGRRTTFIVLTAVFGTALGALGLFSMIAGWLGAGGREEHMVHDSGFGVGAAFLIAAPLLLQASRPERKLSHMHAAALGLVGFGAGYALGGAVVFLLGPLVIVALLWWLHPARDRLALSGRPQPLLAALAVLAAIPLVIYAIEQAEIQRACVRPTEHCEEFHYAGMAALALSLPLVGLAAAWGARGWRIVAWLVGAAATLFGLSGILLPDRASSVGRAWGMVAVGGGIAFVLVAEWVRRREARIAGRSPVTGST